METCRKFSECTEEKRNRLDRQIRQTREKMELETRSIIEAARTFTSEWVGREVERAAFSGNVIEKTIGEIPTLLPSIVETQLDRDEYWPHRKELHPSGISLEFIKEKTRKDLNAGIRMVLGCAAELISDPAYAAEEKKVWIRERGRRRYVCILNFPEEMEASLNRYFTLLEKLLSLGLELNSLPDENRRTGKSSRTDKNNFIH